MRQPTRSIALLATLMLGADPVRAEEQADLVVHNATVYTVNAAQPRATAFAVKGRRFVAVGSDEEMKALGGPDTRRLDLGGKTVVPGFIDAHAHPRPNFAKDSRWYN